MVAFASWVLRKVTIIVCPLREKSNQFLFKGGKKHGLESVSGKVDVNMTIDIGYSCVMMQCKPCIYHLTVGELCV